MFTMIDEGKLFRLEITQQKFVAMVSNRHDIRNGRELHRDGAPNIKPL